MPLDRYGLLSGVLQVAQSCLDDANPAVGSCPFVSFVGIGEPPQDCSSLSARWVYSRVVDERNKCWLLTEEMYELTFIQCCLSNVGEEFDALKEDTDAQCFLNTFGYLYECLLCTVGTATGLASLNVAGCQEPFVKAAITDSTVRGGCYEGVIQFGFQKLVSCCEV